MENEDNKLQETSDISSETSRRTRVGFPQVKVEKKGKKGKIVFIFLAILALVAVGVWLVFGQGGEDVINIEPTPTTYEEPQSPTPTPVEIDRSEISVQILNGSGISGAAGDLKEEMEELGYSDIEVGNTSSQNYEVTEVTFSSEVAQEVKDEIINKLEDIYKDVESETGVAGEYDVKVIIGYPKGHTPSPTKAAATATPTETEASALTSTPTPTP